MTTKRQPLQVQPGDVQRVLDDLEARGLIVRDGDRYFTPEGYRERQRKAAVEALKNLSMQFLK